VDFRESLEYLYGLQRFGIKLGLGNIRALLDRLGHPEDVMPIIHVGGTNGKGSVCTALSGILTAAGYRAGLYTSPHLHSFTERIRIGQTLITEERVASLTEAIRFHSDGIPATFFEFTTAMALRYFSEEKTDCALLEVGMGGRLDATNAIRPAICALTSVCLDHTEHLGVDLAAIASEKAGIIKDGVPVVVAPQEPAALSVIEKAARERRSDLYLLGRDYHVESGTESFTFHFPSEGVALRDIRPELPGRHQHSNLAVALAVAVLFRRKGFTLPDDTLREGVENARWPGRLEWWRGEREILLDGAHNEGGARVLADYLRSTSVEGVRWVAGLKGDKNPQDIFSPLLPLVKAVYCTSPPVEDATRPGDLARISRQAGRPASEFRTTAEALEAALKDRCPGEIVLVAGSLFLVAAAREHLLSMERM